MVKSWKVKQHTGDFVQLERDGELLAVELPIDPGARLIFMKLSVGQAVDDAIVRILTGKTRAN